MRCKIIFTDTAKSHLREIAINIVELSKNKDLAKQFVKELQKETAILEQYPESGSIPKDRFLKSSGYRFLVHKDYLLFYLFKKAIKIVYVMAIFYGKPDHKQVMKEYL